MHTIPTARCRTRSLLTSDAGFSLPELLVATTVMLLIGGSVTGALMQMSKTQQTIWNRTEMHAGVRSATELMQQEVGQAGRVALPGAIRLSNSANTGATSAVLTTTTGLFAGELVTVDTGATEETVTLTAVNAGTNTISFTAFNQSTGFVYDHGNTATVVAYGGFANGIVPTTATNGSTGSVLKMFGDLNGDGNMVYVEYTCDTTAGYLYRNSMAWNAGSKPAVSASNVLLSNVLANPGGAACFTYQQQVVGTTTYVIDVAITLTVQTQQVDAITQAYQTETKALLNVAPRNIFNAWQLASQVYPTPSPRVQPTPATVTALLP